MEAAPRVGARGRPPPPRQRPEAPPDLVTRSHPDWHDTMRLCKGFTTVCSSTLNSKWLGSCARLRVPTTTCSWEVVPPLVFGSAGRIPYGSGRLGWGALDSTALSAPESTKITPSSLMGFENESSKVVHAICTTPVARTPPSDSILRPLRIQAHHQTRLEESFPTVRSSRPDSKALVTSHGLKHPAPRLGMHPGPGPGPPTRGRAHGFEPWDEQRGPHAV